MKSLRFVHFLLAAYTVNIPKAAVCPLLLYDSFLRIRERASLDGDNQLEEEVRKAALK